MAKAVKLKDIADRIGVSTVTVSKALSDQKGVGKELRTRIKQLAQEMGYISPSALKAAQQLRSYNIGVIVSERYFDQTKSFYWLVYQELATRALSKNCFSMLEMVNEADEKNCAVPKLIEGGRVDGIVIIGLMRAEYLKMIRESTSLPVVYLDFYEKGIGNESVVTDNYFGMYQLVNYLCGMGHSKIAYVGTLFSTNSITDRYFGYCKALMENGIEVRRDYVIDDRYTDRGSRLGYHYTLPEDMPTAFACNCDVTALEIIDLLEHKGYRVPEDISVVGFDGYAYGGEEKISLTTYEVDVREMARRAVKILIRKMSGDYTLRGTFVVEGRMVIGETVKKIN
ncbi:MAG: LacI family DNA-binding transcriptional regulator [Lachnospiraceae bacterium]|nr:LacI family DNA-binding transcriptional regulator [Lachnospiraceae bacterium]